MNEKVRKILFWIFLIILILVLLFLGFYYFILPRLSRSDVPKLPTEIESGEDGFLPDNPIDFEALREQNEDVKGWIYIPETNINYPIMQSSLYEPENFYNENDFNKNPNVGGAIYIQRINSFNFDDVHTILYGHNMKNKSMFAHLHKFEKADFFDSHPNFYIYAPGHVYTYTIFSAYTYDNRHILNSFDFSDKKVFADYLKLATHPKSVYANTREVSVTTDDKIVTMSTCTNYNENNRYLVQGVLTDDLRTK